MQKGVTVTLRKGTRKRLELTENELHLLVFLEQQRLLTLDQMYQIAIQMFRLDLKEYSFKNRIRKYEDYKLVRSDFYQKSFNAERFKYLSIGSGGVDLLIKYDLLDKDYNKQKIYKFMEKKNQLHFLATQQAVVNILTHLDRKWIKSEEGEKKFPLVYNKTLFSLSPHTMPYEQWVPNYKNYHNQNKGAYHSKIAKYMNSNTTKSSFGKTITIVKPDWIVRLKPVNYHINNILLNIELDTGTEPINTLIEKIFNYALLAKENPDQQHYLCIILADNSFTNRSSFTNNSKRRENLLEAIIKDEDVKKSIKNSGLIPLLLFLDGAEQNIEYALTDHS